MKHALRFEPLLWIRGKVSDLLVWILGMLSPSRRIRCEMYPVFTYDYRKFIPDDGKFHDAVIVFSTRAAVTPEKKTVVIDGVDLWLDLKQLEVNPLTREEMIHELYRLYR